MRNQRGAEEIKKGGRWVYARMMIFLFSLLLVNSFVFSAERKEKDSFFFFFTLFGIEEESEKEALLLRALN